MEISYFHECSEIGDGGQAAISLMPNADEHMFVSLRVCNLMVCM